ncbi:peptide deformylase [Calycomorphotria hydatis]|uniref:Peptide deformylase n=1 Tax=Calycomorphotria hydatis TaxID=2528027 RepID=A0A517T782_9PLAN|nr:peptide deformylase [Calycomorphotria hydatis]QDT64232.1 Peptide deformylase [Calycomorphotria hydatis]
MKIVHYPHPALFFESAPVREINAQLRTIVSEMFELMYAANGIGLAANQVGLPLRLFVINPTGDKEEKDQEFVFLNPQILKRNGVAIGEEGCLSLPDLHGDVRRAERITVEAYDLKGQPYRLELNDLPARVVQHEYDHIDGILFLDRLDPEDKAKLDAALEEMSATFAGQQAEGAFPNTAELEQQLKEIAAGKRAIDTV